MENQTQPCFLDHVCEAFVLVCSAMAHGGGELTLFEDVRYWVQEPIDSGPLILSLKIQVFVSDAV